MRLRSPSTEYRVLSTEYENFAYPLPIAPSPTIDSFTSGELVARLKPIVVSYLSRSPAPQACPVSRFRKENAMSFEEPLFDDQEEEIPPFRVFVFHGRNPLWKQVAEFVENKLEIEALALDPEDDGDVTDIDALDQASEDASHAIVVVTADDDREKTLHAIGYFQGLYGPNNVLVLRESSVEEFGSVSGVIYLAFEGREIASTFPAVAEEIEASKAEYDQVDED